MYLGHRVLPCQHQPHRRPEHLRLRAGGVGVGPGGPGQDDRNKRAGRPHDPPLQELQRADDDGQQRTGGQRLCSMA